MKKLVLNITLIAIIACASRIVLAESPDDILIIVNKNSGIDSTDQEELRTIFLKKRTSWTSKGKVTPVNAKKGSRLRIAFSSRLLNMNQRSEETYWQKNKIQSGLIEPSEITNTLKVVFKIRGAVSYVFRSRYREGIAKVIFVLPAG